MMKNVMMNKAGSLIARCRSQVILNLLMATLVLFVALSVDKTQAQDNPLTFSGDFRLRGETTTKQEPNAKPDVRDPRYREVVRFRWGLSKKINDLVSFGGRIATGSSDDPNTADITLGDFVNDLTISLDKVYLQLNHENFSITGGKFSNPFRTTEMVWDGDVNPQGLTASYSFSGSGNVNAKLIGIYYMVDEQQSNPDSYMGGGQLQLGFKMGENVGLNLAGAYYNYHIESLVDADAGDTRSNFLNANGSAYLSDFNLIDVIASLDYNGSARFPLRLVGDFVKNQGATEQFGSQDTGFNFELYLGKASKRKDLRFVGGYTRTETDAVLAAFSHDNTTLATNYVQYTFGMDYVVLDNTTLNLTVYQFRRNELEAVDATGFENDWFTRVRLNAVVSF